jgi:hypothetical protein
MSLAERIMVGMDREDNDNGLTPGQRIQSRLLDWIFLPLPLAFLVIGLGILTGLLFSENLLLRGPMKWIIGLALTIYGLVRSAIILGKLRGKRGKAWIEKS